MGWVDPHILELKKQQRNERKALELAVPPSERKEVMKKLTKQRESDFYLVIAELKQRGHSTSPANHG